MFPEQFDIFVLSVSLFYVLVVGLMESPMTRLIR